LIVLDIVQLAFGKAEQKNRPQLRPESDQRPVTAAFAPPFPRKDHRIVFHFTPKHASWLNQIKIWFSILVRKLIRRGNFASKDMLKTRIEQFIAYFNATMVKPFRWTYAGKPLAG
jgi:transposase